MEAYVIFREPAFNPWEVITKQGAKTFVVLLYAKQIAYPKMGDFLWPKKFREGSRIIR